MTTSLRAFLADILDYAGLFPPARLPLDEAIRNYARYRGEPEAWMLARFICPAARLEELAPYVDELFADGPPLRLAVLGRGGENEGTFVDHLHADLEAVQQWQAAHGERSQIECFETRLPAAILGADSPNTAPGLLSRAGEVFERAKLAALARFYEVPLAPDGRRAVNTMASSLGLLNAGLPANAPPKPETGESYVAQYYETDPHAPKPGPAGIKLRCGGVEAAALPSVSQVATVIQECCEKQVPLKFTAGLHHPTWRLDPGLGVPMHGFLNVFGAGILAYALALDHRDIVAIVEEQDARQFRFSDDFFAWNDAEATADEIVYARRNRVIGFGSCSFDEPRDDLRQLGLL